MEYYKNILCVSYMELTGGDPGDPDEMKRPILTKPNFDYYKSKDKIRVLNRACYGTPALVAYSSLPEAVKEKVTAKYGTPEKNAQNYVLKEMIVHDLRAEAFYATYPLDEKGFDHLPPEKQKEYTRNASVLNAILTLTSNRTLFIKARPSGGAMRVWPETSRVLNAIQAELGCKLPQNTAALKRVAERYKTEGYAALVSGKFNNANARKNKEKEQSALIVELIGNGLNIDNETVAKLYNAVAERMGWKTITAPTVANYKKEHPECYAGRYGKKALANNKLMQVKRYAPTCPMYFWCVDGWDTELFYQSKSTDKATGRSVTVYHHRPTVVAIVDPFNKYIIGYAIGTHETPELIRQAFRNAFEHVCELFGAYYKPWQLQTDNYGRGNLRPFYEACTHSYTPAATGNAKAKMIEPFFNWFNRKRLRLLPNSSGHGVKSSRKIQVSDDWIEAHKRNFPDYAGCCLQIEEAIAFDRSAKREKLLSGWAKMPDSEHLSFDKNDFLYVFGETAKPRKLNGDGIRLQLDGQLYHYDCFDQEFRSYGHATFFLKYNPTDMSRVMAIENVGTVKEPKEGTRRFLLERKHEQPMALKDRKEGDMEELMRIRSYNAEMTDAIILKRKEAAETVVALFDENSELLKNTLTAHIVTDSLGRHKDRRNEVAGRADPQPMPLAESTPQDDDAYEIEMSEQAYLNDF